MEIVEEEERVKLGHFVVAEGPLQMYPCSLYGGSTLPDLFNFSIPAHHCSLPFSHSLLRPFVGICRDNLSSKQVYQVTMGVILSPT